MHFVEKEPSQKRIDFVEKLKSNKILRVPGAYNPLTAKLIEEIGYDAVYISGGVMANDLGFPDIGLTTLQDVSTRSYLISRVTNLPTQLLISILGLNLAKKLLKLLRSLELLLYIWKIRLREKDAVILIIKS